MEALPFIILLVFIILAVPIVLAIWLIARTTDARNRIGELSRRVDRLQLDLLRMTQKQPPAISTPKTETPATPAVKLAETIQSVAPPKPAPVLPPKPI